MNKYDSGNGNYLIINYLWQKETDLRIYAFADIYISYFMDKSVR